jgi:hypothetical protein
VNATARRPYTPSEDTLIASHIAPDRVIAQQIGRSVSAIRAHRSTKLGGTSLELLAKPFEVTAAERLAVLREEEEALRFRVMAAKRELDILECELFKTLKAIARVGAAREALRG